MAVSDIGCVPADSGQRRSIAPDTVRAGIGSPKTPGILVCFTGIDGSGKTTQSRLVGQWLARVGIDASVHADAGGSFVGKVLDELARQSGHVSATAMVGADSLRLAGSLARLRDSIQLVAPDLQKPGFVIVDRNSSCQIAATRALGATNEWLIRRLFDLAPVPDIVFFLDVQPRTALRRVRERGIDEETYEYLSAFDSALQSLPDFPSFVRIDGNRDVASVHEDIRLELVARTSWDPRLRGDRERFK